MACVRYYIVININTVYMGNLAEKLSLSVTIFRNSLEITSLMLAVTFYLSQALSFYCSRQHTVINSW